MNNKNINKPNKKMEFIGMILFIIGILSIIARILIIKETYLTVIGIVLILFGAVCNSLEKVGLQKTVETSEAYNITKAKAITKGIKEGLKDEEK